jgi:hypothetical protein
MRAQILVTGFLILLAGIAGLFLLPKMPAMEFFRGAGTLGGALVICGFFTLNSFWYGVIGAGVISLIGAGKGLLGLAEMKDFLTGQSHRGFAPPVELAITIACLVLLFRCVSAMKAERTRRMLESDR